MSEYISAGERYARACNTSDLRMKESRTTCDADKLVAAGYAARGSPRSALGLALYRAQVTDDRSSLGAIMRDADIALRHRLSRKGNRPMPLAQREALISQTLRWWLSQRCTYCGGTGFDILEGTPTLSTNECAACAGTGVAPLRHVIPPRLLAHASWLAKEWDILVAAVIGDMAIALNG